MYVYIYIVYMYIYIHRYTYAECIGFNFPHHGNNVHRDSGQCLTFRALWTYRICVKGVDCQLKGHEILLNMTDYNNNTTDHKKFMTPVKTIIIFN